MIIAFSPHGNLIAASRSRAIEAWERCRNMMRCCSWTPMTDSLPPDACVGRQSARNGWAPGNGRPYRDRPLIQIVALHTWTSSN